jgi:hypothetical protein
MKLEDEYFCPSCMEDRSSSTEISIFGTCHICGMSIPAVADAFTADAIDEEVEDDTG